MPEPRRQQPTDRQTDAIDILSRHVRPPTPLEAALRPGCLLSLIITLLIVIVTRRFFTLPLAGYAMMFALVYLAVIGILIRGRPESSVFDDE